MLKQSVSKGSTYQINNKSEFLSQMSSLLDKGCEYIGLINKQGRLEEVIFKQNDLNISEEKMELFFMTIQLLVSMQRDFDEELGRLQYIAIQRQNSSFLVIYTYEGIILVQLSQSTDPFLIVDNFAEILGSCKEFQELSRRTLNIEYI